MHKRGYLQHNQVNNWPITRLLTCCLSALPRQYLGDFLITLHTSLLVNHLGTDFLQVFTVDCTAITNEKNNINVIYRF